MRARIYQPSPNAMQSGTARSRSWVLEYEPEAAGTIDPLMGWTGSSDLRSQVRLSFDSKEEAIEYAKDNGIPHVVREPQRRRHILRQKGYGENFATDRRETWTH